MSTIEVRVQNTNVWRTLLPIPLLMGLFYYVFGYLPFAFWILGGALLLVIPFRLLRPPSNEPCIVLNDEGVLDKRLKIGVVRWRDIRRVYCFSLHGIPYVCLDLHNLKEYEARRPVLLRILSNFQRLFGMSSIAICATRLDIDTATLLDQINAGCEAVYQK